MQKETIRTLANVVLTRAVKADGKANTDRVSLTGYVNSELPGLDSDAVDKILDDAEKLLPYVEVHVEVPYWRLEETEYNARPKEPGAVW